MLCGKQKPSRAAALSLAFAGALASALWPLGARAEGERESLEAVRQTTLALIDLLVQNGTLPREKADALLAEAKKRADAAMAAAAEAAKTELPVVRVPYVPQVVRDQIRNEIREEVLARANADLTSVPPFASACQMRMLRSTPPAAICLPVGLQATA